MIYEADMGEYIGVTAKKAFKADCDKFIHNDRLYEITISYKPVGIMRKEPDKVEEKEND